MRLWIVVLLEIWRRQILFFIITIIQASLKMHILLQLTLLNSWQHFAVIYLIFINLNYFINLICIIIYYINFKLTSLIYLCIWLNVSSFPMYVRSGYALLKINISIIINSLCRISQHSSSKERCHLKIFSRRFWRYGRWPIYDASTPRKWPNCFRSETRINLHHTNSCFLPIQMVSLTLHLRQTYLIRFMQICPCLTKSGINSSFHSDPRKRCYESANRTESFMCHHNLCHWDRVLYSICHPEFCHVASRQKCYV